MNFTRIVFNAKMLSACFFLAAFGGGIRFMLIPWQVYVFCDQILPVDMQKNLKALIEKTPLRTIGANALCTELRKEYPSVRAVSIAYKGSLTAQVVVKADEPWVCLTSVIAGQKEYILCKDGKVIEKKYFNDLVTQGMPVIAIEGNEFMSILADPDFLRFARDVRRDIFDEYTISWKSKVEIVLESKSLNKLIIADHHTVHENERFEYVNRIYKSDRDRYKNGMKADIRLRDEILCSPL